MIEFYWPNRSIAGGLDDDLKKASDGKLDGLSKNFKLYDKTINVREEKATLLRRVFKTIECISFTAEKISRKSCICSPSVNAFHQQKCLYFCVCAFFLPFFFFFQISSLIKEIWWGLWSARVLEKIVVSHWGEAVEQRKHGQVWLGWWSWLTTLLFLSYLALWNASMSVKQKVTVWSVVKLGVLYFEFICTC